MVTTDAAFDSTPAELAPLPCWANVTAHSSKQGAVRSKIMGDLLGQAPSWDGPRKQRVAFDIHEQAEGDLWQ